MNITREYAEALVEEAEKIARDTQVQPSGALRPDILHLCASIKPLVNAFTELVEDAALVLAENDRLRAVEAAAKDIAADNDLMDDPNGYYGYAIGVGQLDRLRKAIDG